MLRVLRGREGRKGSSEGCGTEREEKKEAEGGMREYKRN